MKLKALACSALLCAGFSAHATTTLIDVNQLYFNPTSFAFADDLTAFHVSAASNISGYLDFSNYAYDTGSGLFPLADNTLTGLTVKLFSVDTGLAVATVVKGAFTGTSSFNFGTVAAGNYEIRFTGTNNYGSYLDAASYTVTPVPEPQSLAMLLAGLGTIGFLARRRHAR